MNFDHIKSFDAIVNKLHVFKLLPISVLSRYQKKIDYAAKSNK